MSPSKKMLEKAKEYERIFIPYLTKEGYELIPDAPPEAVEAYRKHGELFE